MVSPANSFWRRPVTSLRIVAAPLAIVAWSLTVAPGHPSVLWRALLGGLWLACGWCLGWAARERRAEIEAHFGLRPRRPDEPPPLEDQPPAGAPVA